MSDQEFRGLELRSLISSDGQLQVSLVEAAIGHPAPDEIIVRVEATPLNPSDVGLLLGPADLSTLRLERNCLRANIPATLLAGISGRIGNPLAVGNEAAGTVMRAGADVQDLLGKRVGLFGGAMYAQFRKVRAVDALVLPDSASVEDGASMFVNPLTSLAMIETMRRGNHTALVHTAAASNLGQMLVRICLADGIDLVNIVRNSQQVEILRSIGACHVVDSSTPDFEQDLIAAIAETGATIAFDAIGGGAMANTILHAMEAVARRRMTVYNRYGSDTFKQVYIYGNFDTDRTQIDRNLGYSWAVSGFLVMTFCARVGPEVVHKLQERVVRELTTTFTSKYSRTISLSDVLNPEIVLDFARNSTGEKYLINPALAIGCSG